MAAEPDKNLDVNDIKKSLEGKIKKSVVVPEFLTKDSRFKFRCGPDVACFTRCCSGIRILLSPYDIFRLKNRLGLTYLEFLDEYTYPANIDGSALQVVALRMKEDKDKSCPFLTPQGCTVYTDRPLTCRYYPIGMGIMKKFDRKTDDDFFIMVKEDHCLGHNEDKEWTVESWRADQESDLYDAINEDWMAVVLKAKTLGFVEFSQRSLDLFYMVSTNLDLFRDMAFTEKFIHAYQLPEDELKRLAEDELEFLKFSLKWLRFTMFGEGDFKVREEARRQAREKLVAEIKKRALEAHGELREDAE